MENIFKNILRITIIICGLFYIVIYLSVGLYDLNLEGINLNLKSNHLSEQKKIINKDTELMLVNYEYGLDEEYQPKDLTIPNIEFTDEATDEEKHVSGIIVKPLEELINEAKLDGVTLLGNSGYRSYKLQKKTYGSRVMWEGKESADDYVAKPGFSEHQTGLCIDITNGDRYFVKGTKEADWLEENCYKFGFIIRYPYGKKHITGIEYEPWHIRYVGKENARSIYNNEITLEEYLKNNHIYGGLNE